MVLGALFPDSCGPDGEESGPLVTRDEKAESGNGCVLVRKGEALDEEPSPNWEEPRPDDCTPVPGESPRAACRSLPVAWGPRAEGLAPSPVGCELRLDVGAVELEKGAFEPDKEPRPCWDPALKERLPEPGKPPGPPEGWPKAWEPSRPNCPVGCGAIPELDPKCPSPSPTPVVPGVCCVPIGFDALGCGGCAPAVPVVAPPTWGRANSEAILLISPVD